MLIEQPNAHNPAGCQKQPSEGTQESPNGCEGEEGDGDLMILDFDKNYRTAMTAIVRNANFQKFPDLKALEGREIVVSGKVLGIPRTATDRTYRSRTDQATSFER